MAVSYWELHSGEHLCSRRDIKRDQKTTSDKQLIRFHKRLMQIALEWKALGYEELNPPVQKGWKRLFVLTEQTAARPDAAFFQTLLDKINETTYSHEKSFMYKKRKNGKKVYEVRPQKLQSFYSWSFERLKLSEKEHSYFNETLTYTSHKTREIEYVFSKPWLFELKVFPNMITKIKIIDPLLEQEEAEIENHLITHNLYPRLYTLLYGDSRYKNRWNLHCKEKYRSMMKTDSIKNLLEEYYKEKSHEQSEN